jgi:hypothetical protein
MKTVRAGLFAMAAALLATTNLHAQDAPAAPAAAANQDVRCFMVGNALMRSSDPTAKAAAPLLIFYYLGRIDALTPQLDLAKAVRDETPGVSADLANTAKVCGDAFNARTKSLGEMAAQQQGAAQTPAP